MRRAAALIALACLCLAGCGGGEPKLQDLGPAPPTTTRLDWVEHEGDPGARLVFLVHTLRITPTGWSADVGVRNESKGAFSLATGSASLDNQFGVMVFPTGDHRDLDQRARAGTLPTVRAATTIEPPPPSVLKAGASWDGTLAAKGALPAGLWLRVSFGPLDAVDDPPAPLPRTIFTWITDHAYRLPAGSGQPTIEANPGSSASAARSPSPLAISRWDGSSSTERARWRNASSVRPARLS